MNEESHWNDVGTNGSGLVACIMFAVSLGLALCTGSPSAAAAAAAAVSEPDFEFLTPFGSASVSIHGAWPGMTDQEFTRLIMTGMEHACPRSKVHVQLTAPLPSRRIVWNVASEGRRGSSRLFVRTFRGSVAGAYAQDFVENSGPLAGMTYTVASLTRRVMTSCHR